MELSLINLRTYINTTFRNISRSNISRLIMQPFYFIYVLLVKDMEQRSGNFIAFAN